MERGQPIASPAQASAPSNTGESGNTAPAGTDVVELTLDFDDVVPSPPFIMTILRQEQLVFATHLQAQVQPATTMELPTSQVTSTIASPVQVPASPPVQEEELNTIGAFDTSFVADDNVVYPGDPVPDQLEDAQLGSQEEEQRTSEASTPTTREHIESN